MSYVGDISEGRYNSLKTWTPSAIKCYQRNCNCNSCDIVEGLESVTRYSCQMKTTVLALVKKFGPPEIKKDDYLEEDN